ncbi:HipA N-terminal domain-containing protein [Litoribacter populi]|uniref:HipA N-terminal domain-containing protein n=1 Tax=Litoribacter populi TaxID=2598460 RepID=UPI001F38499E|nr:HipA N-terminal domain-containing protein [Litoribacter populi]
MANRIAKVYMHDALAGWLVQDDTGYHFTYASDYLARENVEPISLTLPLQSVPFDSLTMFPFFDGLIPEGWLLDIAEKNWKLDSRDRMGLLRLCCKDTIGAVSIVPERGEG